MKSNNNEENKEIWGFLGAILKAGWQPGCGHHDLAQRILLSDMKAKGVITGGRPSWAPPQRSSASLKLIPGVRDLSKADVLVKNKVKK